MTNYIDRWRKSAQETKLGWDTMIARSKELGFSGVLKATWDDLFANRSIGAWVYLILLTLAPVAIELYYNGAIQDWLGMMGSITGILCVIFVSEGRVSNYLWGTINSLIYVYLTIGSGFYGEVATTLYFLIMQPIGFFLWFNAAQTKTEQQEFVAKRLDIKGWIKYLFITLIWWGAFGFIYKSIGSKRPFRDSVTDGTNGVGQLLMNGVYLEQWLFWAATNVFSIYLWWGESIQMQGMYWVYLLNCVVGAFNWYRQAKRA